MTSPPQPLLPDRGGRGREEAETFERDYVPGVFAPWSRAVADAAERDMATLTINVFGAPSDAAVLDLYREAGIDRAILSVPSAGADAVLPLLDSHAKHLP